MNKTSIYQIELQHLRMHDTVYEMNFKERDAGYGFITTAGHGYLVVPKDNKNYELANSICQYGYKGDHAIYLEEDDEAGQFIKQL
jgi:hypothetical protein